MGAASSKKGRYVVNPDPMTFHPESPSNQRRYAPIRSPVHKFEDTPDHHAKPRKVYLGQNDSVIIEEFYTPDTRNAPSDSVYHTPSNKLASASASSSASAETLQCTVNYTAGDHQGFSNGYKTIKGDTVVQQQEQGKTVTHFLPYSMSIPFQQECETTAHFVPYSTSTPHKQHQVERAHHLMQAPPVYPSITDQEMESKLPGSFTILDALFLIGSMIMYIVDIVMDILVAIQYFRLGEYLWSGMTMGFIIVSSITLQYFSLRWHFADSFESSKAQQDGGNLCGRIKAKFCTIITWIMTHILQLGPINRYWRTLKFGWRSRSGKTPVKDYNAMVREYRDTTMLRLLEAFMESAPQLVLQLYIMTQQTDIHWLTAASALSSLASVSWSLEAYHKALREAESTLKNIGWFGLGFRMTAQTFLITSRVISLALFAAYFNWWMFVVVGTHWLFMTVWLICQNTKFCGTRCEEVMFDGIIGIVHIFSFFSMKTGRTRYRALGFYTLVFVENSVMFALWYKTIGEDTMYGLPALVLVGGGFFLGITIMLVYYRFLHPDGPLPLCDCRCSQKNSADTVEGKHCNNNGSDTIDGLTPSHEPKSNKKKNKKIEGNMFSRSGRHHLYWVRTIPYADKQTENGADNIPKTKLIFPGDVGHKTERHAFLETSLL